MVHSFKILSTICSILCVSTFAHNYHNNTEHKEYKPAQKDSYWKYAQQNEKSVMAFCTDSDSYEVKDGQFEGLSDGNIV